MHESGSWQWESGAPWPSDSPPAPAPAPGHCLTLGEEGAWGAAPCGEGRGVICEIVRELAGEEGGATGRSDLSLREHSTPNNLINLCKH